MSRPTFIYSVSVERATKPYNMEVVVEAADAEHAISVAKLSLEANGYVTGLAPDMSVVEVAVVCAMGINLPEES